MRATSLLTLTIVLLAASVANFSTTGEAYEVPVGAMSQNGYLVAYRDILRMLLEKQPMIYQEIMSGQLRPGNQPPRPVNQANYNPLQIPEVISMDQSRPMRRTSPRQQLVPMQGMSPVPGASHQMQQFNNRLPSQTPSSPSQSQGPNQFGSFNQMSNPSAHSSSCVPSRIKPDISSLQVKNVASVQDKVLANMAGYVELVGPYPSYLPLNIEYVSVSEPDSDGTRTVTLEGDCVSFDIKYQKLVGVNGDPSYSIKGLEMLVKGNDEQDGELEKICDFDKQLALTLYGTVRYSCSQVLSHRCSVNRKRVANLVLRSFELEFDGDFSPVRRREFSTGKLGDSCDYWNR